MRKFKVWNCTGKHWIEDGIDNFVELNWTMPGYDHAGESFVEAKPGMNVEIVWQDDCGNFISPSKWYDG
jgi:hypothetical protein